MQAYMTACITYLNLRLYDYISPFSDPHPYWTIFIGQREGDISPVEEISMRGRYIIYRPSVNIHMKQWWW